MSTKAERDYLVNIARAMDLVKDRYALDVINQHDLAMSAWLENTNQEIPEFSASLLKKALLASVAYKRFCLEVEHSKYEARAAIAEDEGSEYTDPFNPGYDYLDRFRTYAEDSLEKSINAAVEIVKDSDSYKELTKLVDSCLKE